jgi:molecular chaperone GrpE
MSQTEEKEKTGQTGAADEVSAAPAAEPESELDALRREIGELKDKNLRLLAEVQNQQKRFAREKQDALRYAEADFAKELLVILDDFERTQESAKSATDAKAVAEGVRIVYDHFLKVLQQRGITTIESVGKPFDPNIHEALMQQPSADAAPGTVLHEAARGYKMHDRVLRSARVIVSAGEVRSEK